MDETDVMYRLFHSPPLLLFNTAYLVFVCHQHNRHASSQNTILTSRTHSCAVFTCYAIDAVYMWRHKRWQCQHNQKQIRSPQLHSLRHVLFEYIQIDIYLYTTAHRAPHTPRMNSVAGVKTNNRNEMMIFFPFNIAYMRYCAWLVRCNAAPS